MKSINAIAWKLGIPASELDQLSQEGRSNYRKSKRLIGQKYRTITVPRRRLKKVQKRICSRLLASLPIPDHLHGSVKGKSAFSNAAAHQRDSGQQNIITMDIADFFPSISPQHVLRAWERNFDLSPVLSSMLTRLTTVDYSLPQGAPTSPGIANLVLDEVDTEIREACSDAGVYYTRYVDDLTFSGRHADELIEFTATLLQQQGFKVSRKKVQKMHPGSPQKVTGYVINGKSPSVGRAYFDRVRATIHQLDQIPINTELYQKELASIQGKINHIRRSNPGKAEKLERQLNSG